MERRESLTDQNAYAVELSGLDRPHDPHPSTLKHRVKALKIRP